MEAQDLLTLIIGVIIHCHNKLLVHIMAEVNSTGGSMCWLSEVASGKAVKLNC